MRHGLRGFIVCLFAVALVVNGGVSRILGDTQAANAHHIAVKRAEAGHQKQHQNHHHAQLDGATVPSGELPTHDHADGDTACCTMCIAFDNVVSTFAATAYRFRHRIVEFEIGRQLLIGHLVALDPDIPKTIV